MSIFKKSNEKVQSNSRLAGRYDISMVSVREWALDHYFLHAGDDPLVPNDGYSLDIFGETDGSYYLANQEVKAPGLRIHFKITSSRKDQSPKPGSLGWAKFHKEYVESVLLLHPDQVRDILTELRLGTPTELRVAGEGNENKVFWPDMFMLSPDKQECI